MHESEEGARSTFLLIALSVLALLYGTSHPSSQRASALDDISFGVVGRCVSTSAAKTKTWIATPTDGHHIALLSRIFVVFLSSHLDDAERA